MSSSSNVFVAKDDKYPEIILPDYSDPTESFYPFIRLSEPWDFYEKIKTFLLGITMCPIRILIMIILLPIWTSIGIISSILNHRTSLTASVEPLSLCGRIFFTITRFGGRIGLWTVGFYDFSITHYSYKDMKQKFNYSPPKHYKISYDANNKEIHEKCNIIISNHLGFADIYCLLWHFNGAFVAKQEIRDVFGIGAICKSVHSMFLEKGKSLTETLVKRLKFNYEYHHNVKRDCAGCNLCLTNMVIFPEGTTTNGNDLVMFRTGVFNAGLPITPIIIKCPWKRVNSTWESISFIKLLCRLSSQFYNSMHVYVGPPYIPTDEEKQNSVLFAYNMNILMAQMMGINNENRRARIYLTNRKIKVKCYHHHCIHGTDTNIIRKWAKQETKKEKLIKKYIQCIKNDDRYYYNGSDDDEDDADCL